MGKGASEQATDLIFFVLRGCPRGVGQERNRTEEGEVLGRVPRALSPPAEDDILTRPLLLLAPPPPPPQGSVLGVGWAEQARPVKPLVISLSQCVRGGCYFSYNVLQEFSYAWLVCVGGSGFLPPKGRPLSRSATPVSPILAQALPAPSCAPSKPSPGWLAGATAIGKAASGMETRSFCPPKIKRCR